jgi:hypothetical protein
MSECISLHTTDCLKGIVKREYRARKRGCYVMEDKYMHFLVVAQKLPSLVAFLDSIATDSASRVSLTALYQITDSGSDNRVGGFVKNRWRIRFVQFEDVCAFFEKEKGRFRESYIVGQPDCYCIEREGAEQGSAPPAISNHD